MEKRGTRYAGHGNFQNVRERRRRNIGRSSGREMVQGPLALRSKAPLRQSCLVTFSLRKCSDNCSLVLNSLLTWPWHTKCNVACKTAKLRKGNKQESNTLYSISPFTGLAKPNLVTRKPLHPGTL